MEPRQQKIYEILKKDPNLMCIDAHANKLYVLLDGEFLLCLVGPDFLRMTEPELRHYINRTLED